jgi:hypothetical protein
MQPLTYPLIPLLMTALDGALSGQNCCRLIYGLLYPVAYVRSFLVVKFLTSFLHLWNGTNILEA